MLLSVRSNRRLSGNYRLMRLAWAEGLGAPQPGQFVMVRTRETTDPLWRRPFAVHDFRRRDGGAVLAILYQVVGTTTRELAARRRGDTVDLLGPLGRGFALPDGEHWLVAGGRGVAPLFYLARKLRRRRFPCRVMIGGKSAGDVLRVDDFVRLGCRVAVATEDGSLGRRGFVTALLESALKKVPAWRRSGILISVCGPEPMLRAVAQIAAYHRIAAQVSIDPLMACGQGLCLGCTVRCRHGNRLACKDGPVFTAGELYFNEIRNPKRIRSE